MITHDLARPRIGDQPQIQKRFLRPNIGDVRHPDLVAAADLAAGS